jgi:hypothetical protein
MSSVSVMENDMLSEFSKVNNDQANGNSNNSIEIIRDIIFTS